MFPLVAFAQIPGPKLPGAPGPQLPSTPKFTSPLPKLTADPLTVTMQSAGSGPLYMPVLSNCQAQSVRFDSRGGFAPITWYLSGSMLVPPGNKLSPALFFELVDPSVTIANSSASERSQAFKFASPTTRLLHFRGSWGGGGDPGFTLAAHLTVFAADGTNKKSAGGITFEIRPTRACGAPALTGASQAAGGAATSAPVAVAYTLQVVDFDTRDNLDPNRTRETRAECTYPSGLRVDCFYNGQLGFQSDHCPSPSPCRIHVLNLEGSGTVTVRLRNPYGVSAPLSLNVAFSSAVLTENQTFALPSTITKDPATVTGTPNVSDYMGEAPPSCPNTYLVWRGLTFSDPSGRATLTRPVTPGARVSPSTMPQWSIAPGAAQITFQVSYEVERRYPVCPALVIQ